MEQEQINIEDIMQEIRAEIRAKGYEDNEIPFSDIACLVGGTEVPLVRSDSARSASGGGFPCSVGRPYAEGRALRLEIHSQNWSEARQNVELGRIQHSTKDPGDK